MIFRVDVEKSITNAGKLKRISGLTLNFIDSTVGMCVEELMIEIILLKTWCHKLVIQIDFVTKGDTPEVTIFKIIKCQ